jgi:hypothetical protein
MPSRVLLDSTQSRQMALFTIAFAALVCAPAPVAAQNSDSWKNYAIIAAVVIVRTSFRVSSSDAPLTLPGFAGRDCHRRLRAEAVPAANH